MEDADAIEVAPGNGDGAVLPQNPPQGGEDQARVLNEAAEELERARENNIRLQAIIDRGAGGGGEPNVLAALDAQSANKVPIWSNLSSDQSAETWFQTCLLYTSPSPRDKRQSRMPSSA